MAYTEEFVRAHSQAVTNLLQAAEQLTNLRAEYNALNLGATITDADVVAAGIPAQTAAQFIDGITAAENVTTVVTTNTTNLNRQRRR